MSTYLVAFFVGQFNKNVADTERGLLYGAWARPQYIAQTQLALDVGRKTIVNYEDYFNISFPLPKQGQYERNFALNQSNHCAEV
ncbi:hypothetical protein DPMN_005040 [Dreissena polymorpha]|uniref:Uncharacterized protein n=1 Tax=Dreissena polymorpha TaxID=45954 RepID=A0A9D4MPJ5_DREPO|nr:hypothetical protein DPMN_005040 [Dreissena polymorpha]